MNFGTVRARSGRVYAVEYVLDDQDRSTIVRATEMPPGEPVDILSLMDLLEMDDCAEETGRRLANLRRPPAVRPVRS